MMSPHVIAELNRFIRDENAIGATMYYDATGRLLRVESLDGDGKVINEFRRVHLASWVYTPCESFIEWVGVDTDGGSVYYSPERLVPDGK